MVYILTNERLVIINGQGLHCKILILIGRILDALCILQMKVFFQDTPHFSNYSSISPVCILQEIQYRIIIFNFTPQFFHYHTDLGWNLELGIQIWGFISVFHSVIELNFVKDVRFCSWS